MEIWLRTKEPHWSGVAEASKYECAFIPTISRVEAMHNPGLSMYEEEGSAVVTWPV
jgi:hypothetical protein